VEVKIIWFIYGTYRVKISFRNWRDIQVITINRICLIVGVVLAVASHPSENIIASGSLDKDVYLWFAGDVK